MLAEEAIAELEAKHDALAPHRKYRMCCHMADGTVHEGEPILDYDTGMQLVNLSNAMGDAYHWLEPVF